MRACLPLLWAVGAGGCSVIFDGDDLIARDAAAVDAELPRADVDPLRLMINAAEPARVEEGSGCVLDGGECGAASRPVPVVLLGQSFAAGAEVEVTGAPVEIAGEVAVSGAGDMLALGLVVPVLTDLDEGDVRELTLTVSQAGIERTIVIDLVGLDELAIPADCPGAPESCDVSALGSRFSRVDITGDATLVSDQPVVWSATAEIVLDGRLDVGGSAGTAAQVAGQPGPGGCRGGGPGDPAPCQAGGGKAGGDASGGGGGGGATAGGGGGGDSGGDGGAPVAPVDLTPLLAARGNGGGGGGKDAVIADSLGGAGGGGGGVIALLSEGTLRVGEGGGIVATGGPGGPGEGGCDSITASPGGGGGGSGGAILLRGARGLTDQGTGGDRLTATGGAGGREDQASCASGGPGSDGRIRLDSPQDGALPAIAASGAAPDPSRGPVLIADLPSSVTEAELEVTVVGAIGATYGLHLEDRAAEMVATEGDHLATRTVSLSAGLNRICAKVRTDVNLGTQEGIQCYTVAYLPP